MTLKYQHMKKWIVSITAFIFLTSLTTEYKTKWVSLFDGKSLEGWKVGNNANTFSIEDGTIAVNGNVAHLFYDGSVQDQSFKNFEFRADVKTLPGSNSGIYFNTELQQSLWPQK